MPLSTALAKSIIDLVHPDYESNRDVWEKNEAFFRADEDVYEYLKKFQWESGTLGAAADGTGATGAEEFSERKKEAVYVNFPALTSERFNGVLFAKPPIPNFGTLGNPIEEPDSNAAIFYNACDGVGTDARTWDQFWDDAMHIAPATKFRWVFLEAPPERPQTQADERSGLRPYVIEWSPLSVPFWKFSRGQLDFCRVELEGTEYVVKDGKVTAEAYTHHYIMARTGFMDFGEELAAGGWWMVDDDGNPLEDANGNPREGTWDATYGEIPMARLYYEQGRPSNNKQGMSHLVRLTQSYMNLYAALMNDAWESGSRTVYAIGVSPSQWDAVVTSGAAGGRVRPIPAEAGTNPSMWDSGQVSASQSILTALDKTLELIVRFIMRELTTAPDASGEAKRLELLDGKAPRLSHMASNLESAQRTIIRFAELRWGATDPQGDVVWPKEYDLKTLIQKIREALETMATAGASSPTLITELVMRAIREQGLSPADDEDAENVEATVAEELRSSIGAATQANALAGSFLDGTF